MTDFSDHRGPAVEDDVVEATVTALQHPSADQCGDRDHRLRTRGLGRCMLRIRHSDGTLKLMRLHSAQLLQPRWGLLLHPERDGIAVLWQHAGDAAVCTIRLDARQFRRFAASGGDDHGHGPSVDAGRELRELLAFVAGFGDVGIAFSLHVVNPATDLAARNVLRALQSPSAAARNNTAPAEVIAGAGVLAALQPDRARSVVKQAIVQPFKAAIARVVGAAPA